jgi:hypothetical protein
MSEDRSVLYKIRWEIFIIATSLVLSAVVVLAIPQDFSEKLIEQQKQQKEAMQEALKEKELAGFNEGESGAPSSTIP